MYIKYNGSLMHFHNFLQPEEIGVMSHQIEDGDNKQDINNRASQEMFDSIIKEVVEEIGVPPDTLVSGSYIFRLLWNLDLSTNF